VAWGEQPQPPATWGWFGRKGRVAFVSLFGAPGAGGQWGGRVGSGNPPTNRPGSPKREWGPRSPPTLGAPAANRPFGTGTVGAVPPAGGGGDQSNRGQHRAFAPGPHVDRKGKGCGARIPGGGAGVGAGIPKGPPKLIGLLAGGNVTPDEFWAGGMQLPNRCHGGRRAISSKSCRTLGAAGGGFGNNRAWRLFKARQEGGGHPGGRGSARAALGGGEVARGPGGTGAGGGLWGLFSLGGQGPGRAWASAFDPNTPSGMGGARGVGSRAKMGHLFGPGRVSMGKGPGWGVGGGPLVDKGLRFLSRFQYGRKTNSPRSVRTSASARAGRQKKKGAGQIKHTISSGGRLSLFGPRGGR